MFTKRTLVLAPLIVGFTFFACSEKESNGIPEEEIIAKVGDRLITAEEFKYSFEFSPAPLRMGANPRETFLDYMLKERLLSLEGYRQGFHRSPYVTRRVRHRRYNDLLESFYRKYVHGRVKIPEDKLQEATRKSTVKWRMRIWPTPSLQEANAALAAARQIGLPEYMRQQFARQEVPLQQEKYYETNWIDYLEIRPEILEGIKDLNVGEISDPIPFDGGYALFQIIDIQLTGIRADDLKRGVRRRQIEARLRNIEADKIVHALMDSILTPLEVRVKGSVVERLTGPLFKWVGEGLPVNQSVVDAIRQAPDSAKSHILALRGLLDQPLVTYQGGYKTVEDYLQYMDYFRRGLKRKDSEEEFQKALVTEIGRMVKNDIFVGIAEQEGFAESAEVAKDLELWEEKWTYDAYRFHLVEDTDVTEEELRDYFTHHWRELDIANVDTTRFYKYRTEVHAAVLHQKHLARLEKELAELRKRYPIWINEERLHELQLSDDPKSRTISVFLLKRFSHKLAIPPVDLNWIGF